ncbi:unnamed protein product [Lasius platythorax]|uniref:Uncharacterized protein n=1 Tax=Lasius platythorax TaxID=488582 RepID=A0AAV2N657_9HYME
MYATTMIRVQLRRDPRIPEETAASSSFKKSRHNAEPLENYYDYRGSSFELLGEDRAPSEPSIHYCSDKSSITGEVKSALSAIKRHANEENSRLRDSRSSMA